MYFLKFLKPGGGKFAPIWLSGFQGEGFILFWNVGVTLTPLPPHAEVTEYKKIFTLYEKIYDILFQITDDIPNKKVSVYNISTPNNVISLQYK